MVCFHALAPEVLGQIVSRNLGGLRQQLLDEHGIELAAEPAALTFWPKRPMIPTTAPDRLNAPTTTRALPGRPFAHCCRGRAWAGYYHHLLRSRGAACSIRAGGPACKRACGASFARKEGCLTSSCHRPCGLAGSPVRVSACCTCKTILHRLCRQLATILAVLAIVTAVLPGLGGDSSAHAGILTCSNPNAPHGPLEEAH